MEPDAVTMILMQASKLHERFDDTIEKAKAWNPQAQTKNAAAAAAADSSSEEEVKSLSSIRDALEVLEDQLDCLQILQRQQQADKEAALSDLEESRKIFLERLRRHNGRSWAVVKDAFAFAGEAEVDDADRHQNQNQTQNQNEEAANTTIPGKDEDDEDGKPSTVNMVAMKSLEWSENNGGKKKIEDAMSSQRPGGMLHTIIMRAASFTVVGFGLMVFLSFNRRKINKARRCRSEEDDDVIGSVSIKNYE